MKLVCSQPDTVSLVTNNESTTTCLPACNVRRDDPMGPLWTKFGLVCWARDASGVRRIGFGFRECRSAFTMWLGSGPL